MDESSGFRKTLVVILFVLSAIIVFGLFWFFAGSGSENPEGVWWFVFSFAAGLTMIVLPCTLPLAFVIVPLSMGKGPVKGFFIALAFGIGVALTLSMYGVLAAVIGKVFVGILGTSGETLKNWLYFIAGLFAYLFALGTIGLIKFKMPSYTGAFPAFIQRQGDVVKALLLGLFLGNIGVGCPHPATPVIFTQIVTQGNILYGWLLFLVHAIGRVLPLIFLAILGILGVNALGDVVKKKDSIERATGWAMIFVAAFILVLGLFSHDWWLLSGTHTLLEDITQEESILNFLGAKFGTGNAHHHGPPPADHTGLFGLPLSWGTWTILILWIAPMFWYYKKRRAEIAAMQDPDKMMNQRTLPYLFWNIIVISLLLITIFGYTLPARFLAQAQMMDHENMSAMTDDHGMMAAGGQHAGHTATYHEIQDITRGIAVDLVVTPPSPTAVELTRLDFAVNVRPETTPVPERELQIQHEKTMHVIGARNDLTNFFHIHPLPETPDSSALTTFYAFPAAGSYKIWSEITYQDETHVIGYPLLTVTGTTTPSPTRKELSQNVIVGNYQVGIDYGTLGIGENDIHFTIRTLAGAGVELNHYLGEKMHLAVISEDLAHFIHAHPSSADHETGAMGGGQDHEHSDLLVNRALAHGADDSTSPVEELHFTIAFEKPGLYKMFAQFQPNNTELTGDDYLLGEFWVNVLNQAPVPHGSELSASGTLAQNWWAKLIISLVLMAILSWGVKRYVVGAKTLKKS